MTVSKITCDRCTREIGEGKRRGVSLTRVVSREPDPSGNGYQASTKQIDVCQECIQQMAEALWKAGLLSDKMQLVRSVLEACGK